MDIISDARAVRCRIIVAEHADFLQLPACDLRHVGHQIVGDPLRILADPSRRMRSHRVEITQQRNIPRVVRAVKIFQNALLHELGRPIGVGRRKTAFLVQGKTLRLAVHRRGRGEHKIPDVEFRHRLQQDQRGNEVVIVIENGLLNALAHCFQPCEVNHPINFVRREDLFQLFAVTYVIGIENKLLSRDLLYAAKALLVRVAKIIHHDDFIARLEQFHHRMRADKARAARHKNCHSNLLSALLVQG